MKISFLEVIKKNIFGFVFGLIFTLTIGAVTAATIANANNVTYNTSYDSSITNVQKALDALYGVRPEVVHYAFGTPTASSPTDYTTMVNQGHNVFAALYSDGTKAVCVVRNGELGCFKNNDYDRQRYYLLGFYSNSPISPGGLSDNTSVEDLDTFCDIYASGRVTCGHYDEPECCEIKASGALTCNNCT